MTMRDILINAGFKYLKDCSSCSGMVEDWAKVVNGKTALLKLRKTYTKGTLTYQGRVTRVEAHNLELVLERNGLHQETSAV